MSKGFLIYAPDSSQKDVVDSAILSALSIKISQNKYNNVALLTNDKTNFVSEYFDEILEFPFNINQFNTEDTGIDNIWQVLHASPFDETIFCINDVLFFNDLQYELEYMSYFNLLFPNNIISFDSIQNTNTPSFIAECKLPNILCDVFYFKKTGKSIYEFFNMLEIVTKNWRDTYYKIMDSHRPKKPDIHTNMSVAMRLSCYDLLCNIYTDKLNYTKPEYGWTEQYNHFLDDKCNLIIQNHKVISPLVINDENFVTEDVLNTYKTIYEIKNESN